MLPPGLQSPRQVVLYYDSIYHDLIENGQAFPFLSPHATFGFIVIFLYLLIDHRRSRFLRWLRYPTFGTFTLFQIWCTWCNRARTPAAALGSGLLSAFTWLSVFAVMMSNDCQADFRRLERADSPVEDNISLAKDRFIDGSDKSLYWQSYPSNHFLHRIEWVFDLFISFRGVGWNWQISGIPAPPHWTHRSDGSTVDHPGQIATSRTGIRRYHSHPMLVKAAIQNCILAAIALDIIVCTMHNDPYFWGYTDALAPAHLPSIIRQSAVLLRSYRLLFSLAGVYAALFEIFSLGPILFAGILGSRRIGLRGEAWMNPLDTFGSLSGVANHGLAGWWGGWWHQTFRFTFEAPTAVVLRRLGLSKRSLLGKTIAMFLVFFLSGFLHATGSYTQLGETNPISGPMCFFLLQAVGMSVQSLCSKALKKTGLLQLTPRWTRQASNSILVLVWMYYTAPLLVDDFAKGGAWLYEPLPISISRGLGFGPPDEGWYAWWYGPVWIRHGKHWYDSGLQL